MFKLETGQDVPVEKTEKSREILVSEPRILERVNNRIYFYSEIDRAAILKLNRNLREMSNEAIYRASTEELDETNPIFLHISSYGGSIFSGLAGMDEIIKTSDKVKIITIVDGCCGSAATFLSIVGKERLINKHAYMLIHQLSSFMWGKYEEFKDNMDNLDKLMEMIKQLYKAYTKLPEKKLEGILKHDLWFNSKECLKYGLVDRII